jgi:ribonuclease HIII
VLARTCSSRASRSSPRSPRSDLHKGAGEPTDRSAREFVKLHGREALARVAKLHFKNTQKIRG